MKAENPFQFRSLFAETFAGDLSGSLTSRQTANVLHSSTRPTAVSNPSALLWSTDVAGQIELSEMSESDRVAYFSGNKLLPKSSPVATRYGGHQFGHWAGQLGDGRAILLGDRVTSKGLRFEIQLKGAGITAYSRRGDGRAVLRSSLREYLCSEAMHFLGVPTTRALALTLTGEEVVRDMLYDGNPAPEPGAIVTRVSPSFLRFGHFQILAAQGELGLLKQLVDFSISNYFSDLNSVLDFDERMLAWVTEVARRTAFLMSEWARVGFVHGVMNTDNLSLLGLTIDYGPYGFLDAYDADFTPNTTDFRERRYRFENQPGVALWNLTRFAESIAPLMNDGNLLTQALDVFRTAYYSEHSQMMAKKLGLIRVSNLVRDTLVEKLFSMLHEIKNTTEIDYTLFFRLLPNALKSIGHEEILKTLRPAFYNEGVSTEEARPLLAWFEEYSQAMTSSGNLRDAIFDSMNEVNPYFVLRNFIVQDALDAYAKGDANEIHRLARVIQNPYEETDENRRYFTRQPDWARTRPGCGALSCSS